MLEVPEQAPCVVVGGLCSCSIQICLHVLTWIPPAAVAAAAKDGWFGALRVTLVSRPPPPQPYYSRVAGSYQPVTFCGRLAATCSLSLTFVLCVRKYVV